MKKTKPRASKPFSSTMRAVGRPSGETVASVIAFGFGELGGARFVEPARELLERIRRDLALVERRTAVLGAQVGDARLGIGAEETSIKVLTRHCTRAPQSTRVTR